MPNQLPAVLHAPAAQNQTVGCGIIRCSCGDLTVVWLHSSRKVSAGGADLKYSLPRVFIPVMCLLIGRGPRPAACGEERELGGWGLGFGGWEETRDPK